MRPGNESGGAAVNEFSVSTYNSETGNTPRDEIRRELVPTDCQKVYVAATINKNTNGRIKANNPNRNAITSPARC